jgi:hypothetical protein
MNKLTKIFIYPTYTFPSRTWDEYSTQVRRFPFYICIYIYIMSDISSRDSISMVFFFSWLSTWHCVEHSMSGITNLPYVEKDKETGQNLNAENWKVRGRIILIYADSLVMTISMYRKTNIYQSIIDVRQMWNHFDMHGNLYYITINPVLLRSLCWSFTL